MKMILSLRWSLRAAAPFLLAALIAGCSSPKPAGQGPIGKYEVQLRLDDGLKQGSVLVDIVGVNAGSMPRWENYPMSKYWQHSDPMRAGAEKVTFDFSSGNATVQSLAVTNGIWTVWQQKGVSHLVLLADLPGGATDKPGVADPRRQILSLDTRLWPKKAKRLVVVVKQSGLEIETPLQPIK